MVSNITIEGTSLVRLVTVARFDVPVNGQKTVTVALTPQTVGKLEGTLIFVSNDPNQGRLSIALTADVKRPEDIRPPISVLNPFNFSPPAYNVPTQATAMVQNDRGLVPLRLFDVVSDNSQVVIKSYEVNPIDPNKTGAIIAEYTARPYRATAGFVYVYSNAEERPKKVPWSAKEVPLDTLGVVSVLPRDGQTNVSPLASITVEFSDEVFAFGSRFAAVEVDLQPEPKKRNWQEDFSAVGRRVTYWSVPLEPGTTYRLTVLSAMGRRGQELGSSREFLFSTGGSIPATGSIQGTVVFSRLTTTAQESRIDTLSAQGGQVFAVDTKDNVVAEGRIGKEGVYRLNRLLPGDYKVYAEVEGQDRPVNVGLDQNKDGKPDVVKVLPRQTVDNQNVVVADVPVKGEAPGEVTLDADSTSGNQRKLEGTIGADSLASVALYAEGVQELTRFAASVQFDTTRLEFVGFDVPAMGVREDRPILTGRQDSARVVREQVTVVRDAGGVKVEGDKVKVEGKLLDSRKENAPSGTGLLGVLRFAERAGQGQEGGKPVGRGAGLVTRDAGLATAAGDAKVVVKEVTLFGFDRKKTIPEVGVVTIKPPSLRGDIDGNGVVYWEDFFLFAEVFGKSRGQAGYQEKADLDSDGDVDFDDFFEFAKNFGKRRN